jgi:serine/threonine protein kinase
MTFRATEGAEPFPGYILVKRLGTGGFGEVWHATAPGGLAKAVKIIYGNISDSRAEQELRALGRIREVRHPFLLSLDRFETIDDQVVIVMELAEGSLLDRFVQCRQGGHPGVPRSELLGHLRDAADALDYMNDHHDLQHLDIKPQNLLLVGGRIKVADFGLVKDLQGTSASATGGVTPIYAAPEAFDGRVTRSSDQYSLAIVYQEMLTGVRPFAGKSALQLAHQHINCPPVLEALSPEDRIVMAKALAKSPSMRFATCRDMIDALLHTAEPEPGLSSNKQSRPVRTPLRAKLQFRSPTPSSVLAKETMLERPPAVSPEPLGGPASARPVSVRPTLFIGVGGLGGQAIRQLRRRLQVRFGDERRMPIFKVLHIDTDGDSLASSDGAPLTADEVFPMHLYRPEHYRSQTADLLQWLNRRWLYNIPHSLSTEGMRPLGRLAFVDHLPDLLSRLDGLIGEISSPKAAEEAERLFRFRVTAGGPRVLIVAGIAGGTGGGSVLDLGYAMRQVLEGRQLAAAGLCGIFLYPSQQTAAETDLAHINTYATLAELHHYLQPTARYPGDPKRGLKPRTDGVGPFAQTYLLELDPKPSAADSRTVDTVVEYLYANAATSAGEFFDRYRQESGGTAGAAAIRTFGMYWLTIPRFDLAERVGVMLARQLVSSWVEDDPDLRESIDLPLVSWGLDGDSLAQRVSKLASQYLGQDAEAVIGGIVETAVASEADGNPIQRVLLELDSLLGAGVTAQRYVAAGLEKWLHEAAIALGTQTASIVEKWLSERVNDADGRLSVAEECADGVLLHLGAVLHGADGLQETAQANALELRNRLGIGEAVASAGGAGRRKKGAWRSDAADKQHAALLAYARHRLKQISFAAASELVRPIIASVKRFKEDLTVCRDKLLRLLATFRAEAAAGRLSVESEHSLVLLPEGKESMAAAATDLFVQVQAKLIDRLDQLLQDRVIGPLGGLWHAVMANAELASVFGTRLLTLSRELALADMIEMDAAKLFLKAFPREDEAAGKLGACLEAALPPLLEAGGSEHLVAAVPAGEAGRIVAQMAGQTFVNVPTTIMPMESDVVLCWEVSQVSLRDAAAWLLAENHDAMDMARNVLTRSDVEWLLPAI